MNLCLELGEKGGGKRRATKANTADPPKLTSPSGPREESSLILASVRTAVGCSEKRSGPPGGLLGGEGGRLGVHKSSFLVLSNKETKLEESAPSPPITIRKIKRKRWGERYLFMYIFSPL